MKNEIEICKLMNECAVLKRELEQKEKTICELNKKVKENNGTDRLLEKRVSDRIDNKQSILKALRVEIREKDQEIEFLEFIAREK